MTWKDLQRMEIARATVARTSRATSFFPVPDAHRLVAARAPSTENVPERPIKSASPGTRSP